VPLSDILPGVLKAFVHEAPGRAGLLPAPVTAQPGFARAKALAGQARCLPYPGLWRNWWRLISTAAASLSLTGLAHGAEAGAGATSRPVPIVVKDLAGTMVQPLANAGQKATVLFFVMHECPVANGYAPEIRRIISEYARHGVRGFVVYVESDLTLEQARRHARDYGYKSGALLDPQHQLVKAAGATVSPEAAVFSAVGKLLYRGRIDDRVADFGKRRVEPTRRDLRQALDAILEGKPFQARLTKAVGCYIPEDNTTQSEHK
jgi:hypothetical protein